MSERAGANLEKDLFSALTRLRLMFERSKKTVHPPHYRVVSFGDVRVSVQAGMGNYSEPQEDGLNNYSRVELGFPTQVPPPYITNYFQSAWDADNETFTPPSSLEEYRKGVYAGVPIELVAKWIAEKGGVTELPKIPPSQMRK